MSTTMQSGQAPTRKVSLPLIIGIIFLPIIFVWFLLRKGHSTLSRVLGFGWLAVSLIWFAGNHDPVSPRAGGESQAAAVTTPAASPVEQAPKVEPIQVTAPELFNAFDSNEVSAENTYKGKPVLITGRVSSIDTGLAGGVTVALSAGDAYGINQVYLYGINRESAANLAKGQQVSAACTGSIAVLKTPTLRDCTLQ